MRKQLPKFLPILPKETIFDISKITEWISLKIDIYLKVFHVLLSQVNPISSAEETHSNVLTGKTFSDGEGAAEMFVVVCGKPSETNVNIGEYRIKWKR